MHLWDSNAASVAGPDQRPRMPKRSTAIACHFFQKKAMHLHDSTVLTDKWSLMKSKTCFSDDASDLIVQM